MYIFNKHDTMCAANPHNKGHRSVKRTLNVHHTAIYPSVLLCQEMGLVKGAHVAIAFREDQPDKVYIRRADDNDDNEKTQSAKVHSALSREKPTVKFCAMGAAKHILAIAGATKGTFYVAATPTRLKDGKEYYRIITEKPIKCS